MGNGNAPTLQSMCFCEEHCRQTYTDWTAVSPETTETGVADLFYTVLFNGTMEFTMIKENEEWKINDMSTPRFEKLVTA